jgi:DNA-binding MarR family transcriptional regulator
MHIGNVFAAWVREAQGSFERALGNVGVDDRELAALTLVATHDGCSVDWLKHRVGLTQPGTSRLVDRLVGRGLLRRGPSTGRGVPLHVTPAARRVLRAWDRSRDAVVDTLLSGLSTAERRMLTSVLVRSITGADRDRRAADTMCGTCNWAACGADCPVDRSVVSG